MSAAFLITLTDGSWLVGHGEGIRYLALGELFSDALAETWTYPRWLPDLYGGYGYPTFVFYQPLIFLLYAAWRVVLNGSWAMLGALWTLLLVGNAGAYLLGRRFGSRLWAVVVTLVFAPSPYLYVDLFVRQALSEAAGLLLFVWVLYAFVLLNDRLRAGRPTAGAVILLAVSLALVVYAHPIVGIFAVLVVTLLTPGLLYERGRLRPQHLIPPLLALVGAVLLSAPYWLPFVLMKEHAVLEKANQGYFAAERHTVHWHQFFSRNWELGVSVVDSDQDTMPMQLGAAHFALAVLAAWACRRRPIVVVGCLVYLLVIVSMTPWAAPVWRLPVLERVQFPWRALAATTGLQCMLLAAAGPWFDRLRRTPWRALAAALVVSAVAFWQRGQFRTGQRIPDANLSLQHDLATARQRFLTYNGEDEFRPRTAQRPPGLPLGNRPLLETRYGNLERLASSTRYEREAWLRTDRSTLLQINQFYFPGWQVTVDGQVVPDDTLRRHLAPNGLVRVPIRVSREGSSQRIFVRAYYSGPLGQTRGVLAALLGTLLLLLHRRYEPQLLRWINGK